MKQKMKQWLGALLSIALILGLMPGMSLTAYADNPKAYAAYDVTTNDNKNKSGDALTALQVKFNGKSWYIITDDSTAVNAGTVTLLAAESFGDSKFHDSSNKYSTSTIKTTLYNMTASGNSFAGVASAINTVKVKGSESDTEVETKLYLLDLTEANNLPENVLRFSDIWWLRSPGDKNNKAAVVFGTSGVVSDTGYTVDFKMSVRPALKLNLSSVIFSSESKTFSLKPSHTHSFNYNATGATITATCMADGCFLPPSTDGGSDHVATLTIAANGGTYDGTTAYGATITDTYSIRGEAKVQYQKKTDGSYGTATETAPKDAGDYKASITVGGATASVEYTIAQADPTANAPTGLTATYGQTLANVSLEGKNPEGNTPGTWAWADSTQSVGNVVTPAATFKAKFTPASSNYKTVENVEVSVTVVRAANPASVMDTAVVIVSGNRVDLKDNVKRNGATGTVSYEISGDAKGCTLNGSVLTSGDETGTVSVNVIIEEDNNYEALHETPITVTITDKLKQIITASDVTAIYGDTDKSVSVNVIEPETGGGEISYAVKEGSESYIGVDASTGTLIIKAVPTDGKAYVTVTAAETGTFAQATIEVTVTIRKAKAVAATVTANSRTYDGTEKPLVTVTGEATGGEMQYALGDANGATQPYTTSIPAKTDAGTYYVWYKVTGNENYNDTEAKCIEVVINEKSDDPGKDDEDDPEKVIDDDPEKVIDDNTQTVRFDISAKDAEQKPVILEITTVKRVVYNSKKHVSNYNKVNKSSVADVSISFNSISGNEIILSYAAPRVKFKNNKNATPSGNTIPDKKKPSFILSFKAGKSATKEQKKLIKLINKDLKKQPVYFGIEPADLTKASVSAKVKPEKQKITKVTATINGITMKLSKKDYTAEFADGKVFIVGKRNFKNRQEVNR